MILNRRAVCIFFQPSIPRVGEKIWGWQVFFIFCAKYWNFREMSIMVYFFPRVSRNFTRDPWRGNTIYLHIVAKSQVQVFCLIFCHFKDLGQIFPSKVSTNPIPFRDSQNFYCAVPKLGSASHLFKRYWLSNWKKTYLVCLFLFCNLESWILPGWIWCTIGACSVVIGQWDSWSFCGPWWCVYTGTSTPHTAVPRPTLLQCSGSFVKEQRNSLEWSQRCFGFWGCKTWKTATVFLVCFHLPWKKCGLYCVLNTFGSCLVLFGVHPSGVLFSSTIIWQRSTQMQSAPPSQTRLPQMVIWPKWTLAYNWEPEGPCLTRPSLKYSAPPLNPFCFSENKNTQQSFPASSCTPSKGLKLFLESCVLSCPVLSCGVLWCPNPPQSGDSMGHEWQMASTKNNQEEDVIPIFFQKKSFQAEFRVWVNLGDVTQMALGDTFFW